MPQKKNTEQQKLLKLLEHLEKQQVITNKIVGRLEEFQKAENLNTAFTTSAVPLTTQQQKELRINLGFVFGKQFQIEKEVDQDLIGGVKIKIGNLIIDSTIKTQLEKLVEEIRPHFIIN